MVSLVSAARQGLARRMVAAGLVLWVLVGVVIAVQRAATTNEFDYRHGWVSAHFATIARSYLDPASRRAIQVQNNPPLTSEIDTYYGMPPLFGGYLAVGMALLGDHPARLHAWELVLTLAVAAAIAGACRTCFGWRPAMFAAGTFLLLPVTIDYGILLVNIAPAILLSVLTLSAWTRFQTRGDAGAALVGGAALYLAMLASWEAALLGPALAAVGGRRSLERRQALGLLWYGVAVMLALVTVALLFRLQDPAVADQMWQRLLLRTGLGSFDPARFRVHALAEFLPFPEASPWRAWLAAWGHAFGLIGTAGTAALAGALVAWAACRRTQPTPAGLRYVFAPLLILLALYSVAMRDHFRFHDFLILWLAPSTAIAAGYLAWLAPRLVVGRPDRAGATRVAAITAAALLGGAALAQAALSAHSARWSAPQESREIALGRLIERSTTAPAVVLTPEFSMVPVYYARRHVIRGVTTGAVVLAHAARIRGLCAACRFYLAGRPDELAPLQPLIAGLAPIGTAHDGLVYDITDPLIRAAQR